MVIRPGLVQGVASVDYQGTAKDLVHHLKLLGSGSVSRLMALRMAESVRSLGAVENLGFGLPVGSVQNSPQKLIYLVPVPSRPEMTRIRGFVPSVVLANKLAKELQKLGVRARVRNLVRLNRNVKDQAGLTRQGRHDNLLGAMIAGSPVGVGDEAAVLWMVDDVVTTGASLRELHRCLVAAGWNVQSFVTFAETL